MRHIQLVKAKRKIPLPFLQNYKESVKPRMQHIQQNQIKNRHFNQYLQGNNIYKPFSGNPNHKNNNLNPIGSFIRKPQYIPQQREIASANPILITKLFYNCPPPYQQNGFYRSLPKTIKPTPINLHLMSNLNKNNSLRKSPIINKSNDNIIANTKLTNISNRMSQKNINQHTSTSGYKEYFYAEEKNLEHRKTMEDYNQIIDEFCNDKTKSYFAIFDGHSGKEPAQYCRENLHNILAKYLHSTNFNVEKSFNMAFAEIDKELKRKLKKSDSGTTATIALLYQEFSFETQNSQRIVYCANVGDSKSYLISKEGKCKIMTTDHKCSAINEVNRIKKAGGIVFSGRVFGTLALTRSLGDIEMKNYGVVSTPSIKHHDITEDDLYLIIASDGLWDVITEEDLIRLSKTNASADTFSTALIKLSIKRDSRDNVSCICIKL